MRLGLGDYYLTGLGGKTSSLRFETKICLIANQHSLSCWWPVTLLPAICSILLIRYLSSCMFLSTCLVNCSKLMITEKRSADESFRSKKHEANLKNSDSCKESFCAGLKSSTTDGEICNSLQTSSVLTHVSYGEICLT